MHKISLFFLSPVHILIHTPPNLSTGKVEIPPAPTRDSSILDSAAILPSDKGSMMVLPSDKGTVFPLFLAKTKVNEP